MELRWYEGQDRRNGERFWWTQRNKNGVCYEIRKVGVQFALRKCGCLEGYHDSLQEAMDAALMDFAMR